MGIDFTHVIEIHVDDQDIVNRMSGRRVQHPGSGREYHIEFNPPENEGIDDISGEPLIQREDDKPETVLKRLNVYHEQTKPLTDFYKNSQIKFIFYKVDGSESVETVFKNISDNL